MSQSLCLQHLSQRDFTHGEGVILAPANDAWLSSVLRANLKLLPSDPDEGALVSPLPLSQFQIANGAKHSSWQCLVRSRLSSRFEPLVLGPFAASLVLRSMSHRAQVVGRGALLNPRSADRFMLEKHGATGTTRYRRTLQRVE